VDERRRGAGGAGRLHNERPQTEKIGVSESVSKYTATKNLSETLTNNIRIYTEGVCSNVVFN